jgi:hypothetical protein
MAPKHGLASIETLKHFPYPQMLRKHMTDVMIAVIHLHDKIAEFNFMLRIKTMLIRKLIQEILVNKCFMACNVFFTVSIALSSLSTPCICREISGESYERLK